jgi:hypothetical protein
MIIINQTFNIDSSVQIDWLNWLKKVYVPEVMSTGFFTDNKIMRLLTEDEENGNTYAVQFSMPTATYVSVSDDDFMHKFERMASQNFGDKVLFFRTVLEVMN